MGCLKLTYDYEKEPTLKCVWNKNRDGGHNSTIDKPDPFTQAPEYTQSYNRYSYAFNNPLLFTDPSGFVAVDDTIGKDGRIYETFTEPDLNGVKPIPSSAIQFANEHQLTRDEINAFRYEWMVKNNASSYHYIRPDGTVEIRFAEKGLEQPAFDPIDGAFIVSSMLKIAISKSSALAAEKILAREVVEEAAKGVMNFTKSGFRDNLIKTTGLNPAKASQAHHIFPQKFESIFRGKGINIHDPKFGAWWETTSHLKNSSGYNAAWESFLRTNPSQSQIINFGRQLMGQYGIPISF